MAISKKYNSDNLKLYTVIAMIEITAINRAVNRKKGIKRHTEGSFEAGFFFSEADQGNHGENIKGQGAENRYRNDFSCLSR